MFISHLLGKVPSCPDPNNWICHWRVFMVWYPSLQIHPPRHSPKYSWALVKLISFPPNYFYLCDWSLNLPLPGNPRIFPFTYYVENICYTGKHYINERKVLLCFVWDVLQSRGKSMELACLPHIGVYLLSWLVSSPAAERGCNLQSSSGQALWPPVHCWIPTTWHGACPLWGINQCWMPITA